MRASAPNAGDFVATFFQEFTMKDDHVQRQDQEHEKRRQDQVQIELAQDSARVWQPAAPPNGQAQQKLVMQQRDLRLRREQEAQQQAKRQRDQMKIQQQESLKLGKLKRDEARVQQLQLAQQRARAQRGR
jgi:hypothetical protein